MTVSMTHIDKPYIVVVGVDYSSTGDLAFDYGVRLCQANPNAVLHAVHVAGVPNAGEDHALLSTLGERQGELVPRLRDYIERRAIAARERGLSVPARIVGHLRWEAPGDEIAQLASDLEADLVVVGTHGRRGLTRLLMGSVAEAVVRLAPCPVMVVRPKGVPNVPAIEAPCRECLKTRAASNGAVYWCEQHSERHGRRHTYFTRDRIAADGSMPLVFRG
jgi:nucleotide-binding universal stress UspA family protein